MRCTCYETGYCPQVFTVGVHCITSAFGVELCRMLRIIQRFDKQCSCHLQGECVVVGHFWKPYIGQEVGGESLPKMPNHYTFTLKIATTLFAETLDSSQHSTRFNPESRSQHYETSFRKIIKFLLSFM
jgi:hypothetical protein